MFVEKVDNLKKVTLFLESGTAPDRMDLTSDPVKYEFIFGTGSAGITPFEYKIINRSVADEVVICLQQREVLSEFEHIASFINENIETRNSFYLKVRIGSIAVAENGEIIRALAENVMHGDTCSCGCGNH